MCDLFWILWLINFKGTSLFKEYTLFCNRYNRSNGNFRVKSLYVKWPVVYAEWKSRLFFLSIVWDEEIIVMSVSAGNDEGYFVLDRKTGELSLNPVRAATGLDREAKTSYSMDILAYNEVYDDSVIRYRRKRSTNPSIVTFTVEISDENDTPPRFTDTDYYGCGFFSVLFFFFFFCFGVL